MYSERITKMIQEAEESGKHVESLRLSMLKELGFVLQPTPDEEVLFFACQLWTLIARKLVLNNTTLNELFEFLDKEDILKRLDVSVNEKYIAGLNYLKKRIGELINSQS